jgi:hypothetical protein
MTRLLPAQAEDELRHLAQRVAHWRHRRPTPRGRIPQPLWAQAVALSHVLPVSRVAKRLNLCPTRRKNRWEGQPRTARSTALLTPHTLVEVRPPALWPPSPTEVEVQRADGARLRLTYGEVTPALVPLVQTFLESR